MGVSWHEPKRVEPSRMTSFDWKLLIVLVAINVFLLAFRATGVHATLRPEPPPGSHHHARVMRGYYLCLPLLAPRVCYFIRGRRP